MMELSERIRTWKHLRKTNQALRDLLDSSYDDYANIDAELDKAFSLVNDGLERIAQLEAELENMRTLVAAEGRENVYQKAENERLQTAYRNTADVVKARVEDYERVLKENERLRHLLSEAHNQIEYLGDKFQETGSGNATLSRIADALKEGIDE